MERLPKLPIAIRDLETDKVVRISTVPDPREKMIELWNKEAELLRSRMEPIDPTAGVVVNSVGEILCISHNADEWNALHTDDDGKRPFGRALTIAEYEAGQGEAAQ